MRKAILLAIAGLFSASNAVAQGDVDQWEYTITPYLWLPTIEGKLNYQAPPGAGPGTGGPRVEVGPADWLELLNFAALVGGTASKGRAVVLYDFVYLSLETDDNSRVIGVDGDLGGPGGNIDIPVDLGANLTTRTDLDGLIFSLAAGYQFHQTDSSAHAVFIGARYFGLDVETNWTLSLDITGPGGGVVLPAQGRVQEDKDFVDGIIGIKGHFDLGQGEWSVPYSLDVGTGSSDLTWNAELGIAYAWEWGDLFLAYRHLEYDEGDNGLVQDFSFSGPGFGARFSF